MKTGVYRITCSENGRIYIGSSKDIMRRWRNHKSDLRHGQHHSPDLQRDFNQYGLTAFKFEILKECSYSEAKAIEIEFIEKEQPFYNAKCNGQGIVQRSEKAQENFEKKLLKTIEFARSHEFEEGKSALLIDIENLREKIELSRDKILKGVGVTGNGFNRYIRCGIDKDIYIGTLTSDEGVSIVIVKEGYRESGLSYSRLR